MPPLMRIILTSLFTVALTLLLSNTNIWYGLAIIVFTSLLIMLLIDAAQDYYSLPLPELITIAITILCIFLISWLWIPIPKTIKVVGITAEERQFNRIVQAIGDNEIQVKNELEQRFGAYNSDTWKNGLGSVIPATGAWPLYVFFSELPDQGRTLTQGLWGKRIDELQLADTATSLTPLFNCRKAMRNLMEVKSEIYTPFFHNEDFNVASNPLSAVSDKIYAWTDRAHSDAVKASRGCDTKPKASENVIFWIQSCIEPIGGGFVDDKDLQRIKEMGKVCGALIFTSR